MSETLRVALPMLIPGQSLREQAINEALARVDLCLGGNVDGAPSNSPLNAPSIGDTALVGNAPVGAWAGKARAIASFEDAGWRFVTPSEGMSVWDRGLSRRWLFTGGEWVDGVVDAHAIHINGAKVVGSQSAPISDASGGSTVDVQARTTLAKILSALRDHGLIAT